MPDCTHGDDALATVFAASRSRVVGVAEVQRWARQLRAPVACERVESMTHFGRHDQQRAAIARLADAVAPGGQLLFTAPPQVLEWHDVMTGELSSSLGAAEYRRLLEQHGLPLVHEFEDSGENHYYVAGAWRGPARTGAEGCGGS